MASHNTTTGVFTIKGSSNKLHTINFGTPSGEPSCTCHDWVQWRIPCKHFFAIFRLFEQWGWDNPPDHYKSQAHISTDTNALSVAAMDVHAETGTNDNEPPVIDEMELPTNTNDNELPILDQRELPTKKVSSLYMYITKPNYAK